MSDNIFDERHWDSVSLRFKMAVNDAANLPRLLEQYAGIRVWMHSLSLEPWFGEPCLFVKRLQWYAIQVSTKNSFEGVQPNYHV